MKFIKYIWKNKLFFGLILIFCCIVIRVVYTQIYYYNKGNDFYSKNKLKSVFYYSNCLSFYSPLYFYNERCINKLLEIYSNYKKKEKYLEAFYVLEMLKSSIYSIRNIYTPYKKVLKFILIEEKNITNKINFKSTMLFKRKKNNNDLTPNPFFSLLMGIFFIIWLLTTIIFFYCLKVDKLQYILIKLIIIFILWGAWLYFLYKA